MSLTERFLHESRSTSRVPPDLLPTRAEIAAAGSHNQENSAHPDFATKHHHEQQQLPSGGGQLIPAGADGATKSAVKGVFDVALKVFFYLYLCFIS